MFRNMRLSHKLVLLFMVMALLVALTGGVGFWSLGRTGQLLDLQKDISAREKLTVLMKVALQGGRVNLMEAAIVQDPDEFEISQIDFELKLETFLGYCDILQEGNPKLGIAPAPEGGLLAQRIAEVRKEVAVFGAFAEQLLDHRADLFADPARDDGTLERMATVELMSVVDRASVAVDNLLVEVGKMAAEADQQETLVQQRSKISFVGVIILSVLLAAALGIIATRSMVGRIQVLMGSLNRGADGDLTATVRVSAMDELGRLGNDFNLMLEKLSEMMGKVKRSAGELGQVASEILTASNEVIGVTEIQQSSLEETSTAVVQINASQQGISSAIDTLSRSSSDASDSIHQMAQNIRGVSAHADDLAESVDKVSAAITEMNATIQQIHSSISGLMASSMTTASSMAEMDASIQEIEKNAHETAAISEEVHRDAETGRQSVDATIQGMQEIRTSSDTTFGAIQALSQSAQDIGLILSVIKEVTEETRLLSFNASIIAAQSGEHGKGFAVVADEIKNLAERTSESTREIDHLVTRVQDETQRAVKAIKDTEKSVSEGERLSRRSGDALQKIVRGVEKASAQIAGIARSTQEHAKGSQVIRRGMDEVSEMVQQIGKATEEQARASAQILLETENMIERTSAVRESAKDQSEAAQKITTMTEDVSSMVFQIKTASLQQEKGSEQIVMAVENIQTSTRKNLGSAKNLGETLTLLSRQIATLEKETGQFTIQEKKRPPAAAAASK